MSKAKGRSTGIEATDGPEEEMEIVATSEGENTPVRSQRARVLEAIEQYVVEREWSVFPVYSIDKSGVCRCREENCSSPGKHPATRNGFKNASRNLTAAKKLFSNGTFNIGIPTGKSNGLVVLDVDPRSGGKESLKRLRDQYGSLPKTLKVKTGGGGSHYYFKYPEGVDKVKSDSGISGYAGIDIKADGGSVVAPPSNHASGGTYEWADKSVEIAEIPTWLLELTTTPAPKEKSLEEKVFKEGERHKGLMRIAGTFRALGDGQAAIREKLGDVNATRCLPPCDDKELEEIVKYVLSKPAGNSWRYRNTDLQELADLAESYFFEPIAPELREEIAKEEAQILIDTSGGDPKEASEKTKEKILEMKLAVIRGYIRKNGELIHADGNKFYYLNKVESRLYDLEGSLWAAWVYCLCKDLVPISEQRYLKDELVAGVQLMPTVPVYRFSFWDADRETLYISQFNGRVKKLDGEKVTTILNGEEVLFDDNQEWTPFAAKKLTDGLVDPYDQHINSFPSWEGDDEVQSLIFEAWLLSLFFAELCPAKPILILQGEKGSGKSTLLRNTLKYLFGKNANLSGVPDKEDAFTVLASKSHVMALDNFDEPAPKLQDKLARMATGYKETLRKLFTTADEQQIVFRCYLALTSRTPETLKRDDLADRSIILNLRPISEKGSVLPEREMFRQIDAERPYFWGSLLKRLNVVVRAIREGQLPTASSFRMSDWETCGRLFAKTINKEAMWDEAMVRIERNQKDLLLEGDPILDAIKAALFYGRLEIGVENKYTANEMYKVFVRMFDDFDVRLEPCFRTQGSFSKRLSMLSGALQSEVSLKKEKSTRQQDQNRWVYWFELPDDYEPEEPRFFKKERGDLNTWDK